MSNTLVLKVVRYCLAAALLFAGGKHYAHVPLFVTMIHDYRMVPFPVAIALGEIVPRLEMLVGMLLLFSRWLIEAYYLTAWLVVMFLVATVAALLRGLDITCGCWGADSPPISWWHAGFLVTLLGFTTLALRLQFAHEREMGYAQAVSHPF